MKQINYLCYMQQLPNQSLCLQWHSPLFIVEFFQNVDEVDQSAIFRISSISTGAFAAAEVEAPRTECALKIEMLTAASARMLGRGCMVGQTNLSSLLIGVRTVLRRRVDKRVLPAGAKLPF
jgi:hypothetical protein